MNCDGFFMVVGQKDYLKIIVETGKRKAEPPKPDVGAKALQLIEDWAASFKDKRFAFVEVYDALRKKGVVFPPRDTPPPAKAAPSKKPGDVEAKSRSDAATAGASAAATQRSPPREREIKINGGATPEHKSGGAASVNPYSWCSPAYVQKVKIELQQVVEYIKVARSMLVAAGDKTGTALRQDSILSGLVSTLTEVRSRLSRLLVESDLETNEALIDIILTVRTPLDRFSYPSIVIHPCFAHGVYR